MHLLLTGDVTSTVEINSSTANGPSLANSDYFGGSVANIGDLDGDGVNDLVVDAAGDDARGIGRVTVHILYMVEISPVNAPTSLTASVNSDVQIVLQWTASTTLGTGSLISMSVQRDDESGMATIATTSNTSPPYTDTTVVTSQTYGYQVPVSMKVELEHTPI
jgi:hypothetical protein